MNDDLYQEFEELFELGKEALRRGNPDGAMTHFDAIVSKFLALPAPQQFDPLLQDRTSPAAEHLAVLEYAQGEATRETSYERAFHHYSRVVHYSRIALDCGTSFRDHATFLAGLALDGQNKPSEADEKYRMILRHSTDIYWRIAAHRLLENRQ